MSFLVSFVPPVILYLIYTIQGGKISKQNIANSTVRHQQNVNKNDATNKIEASFAPKISRMEIFLSRYIKIPVFYNRKSFNGV